MKIFKCPGDVTMIIPLEIAKELKNLSDEFENLNDRDRLRYFIQESLMQEHEVIEFSLRDKLAGDKLI